MAEVLQVKNLNKSYPHFTLKDVSFSLQEGKITGFIGRNGAGKSTTLYSLLQFVHPDSGEILFWGEKLPKEERRIKQRIGFVSSGMSYYQRKKLKTITQITKAFYDQWDEEAYKHYMARFGLKEDKTPMQLSNGMKIKYALTLALSHHTELFILDEPTSGLDPASREDLLDIFMALCDQGKTILFSTHIISDLDKCADNIIYIKEGQIIAESDIKSFVQSYRIAEYGEGQLTEEQRNFLIGERRQKKGLSALVKKKDAEHLQEFCHTADLEAIMVHLEKEEKYD